MRLRNHDHSITSSHSGSSSSSSSSSSSISSSEVALMTTSMSVGGLQMLEDMASLIFPDDLIVQDQCQLLSDWFGVMVQVLLGLVAFASLLIKLYNEVPRRPFKIWFMDAAKQGFGGLLAHGWNILFSLVLASHANEDACVFYFVNYLIDTILGCALNYLLLMLCERIASWYGWSRLKSGNYGKPPQWSIWAWQFAEWMVIITAVKFFLLYALINPLRDPFYSAGSWTLSSVKSYPKFELTLVMILIPLVLNTIVFWVTDSFLMDTSTPRDPLPPNASIFDDEDKLVDPENYIIIKKHQHAAADRHAHDDPNHQSTTPLLADQDNADNDKAK